MIRFNQFSLARGTKPLFDAATFVLNPGEKAGLIGANGAGKSTLFAVLRGELHADAGDFSMPPSWQIAHVSQETPAVDRTALDYTLDGDAALRAIEARISAASAAHDGAAEADAHAAFADADGYTAPARAEALLLGLGFTLAQTREPVASFSGGWRMRLNLAQALMCRSDLLLLDEPTNHLDLDAIVWLEDWLHRYPGTLVVISHDREFLDAICTVTVHIENQKLNRYGGNYTLFETMRLQQMAQQQAAYSRQQKEIAHLESFITRFKAKATKARQAQSRMKMLAKMEELAPLHVSAPFSFEFREPLRAPNPLLVLEDVSAGYPEKTVLRGITFSLQSDQRIGLLGVNGAGKTTLIKTIAGALPPLAGQATFNKGLEVGYFAQHQVEMLRDDQSPLWHLTRISPGEREQDLRNYLGGFNFPGDMATDAIEHFSGGEKARLALALIVWQRPNLLLLDEPTNHLDLETREALTVALAQFEGTLVLVSHDRHLLRATTDQFLIVSDGKLSPFDGDLDDYRDWLFRTKLAPQEESVPLPQKPAASDQRAQKRREAEGRQARSAARRPLESRSKRLEEQMARLSAKKAAIDARLADAAIYAEDQKDELKTLILDQAYAARELEQLEAEWLELQRKLEELAA